jgi:hypothetical protein
VDSEGTFEKVPTYRRYCVTFGTGNWESCGTEDRKLRSNICCYAAVSSLQARVYW